MTFKDHFNWVFYKKEHSDLQRCSNKEQAWNHVNNYGWKENRIIFENTKINDAFYAFKNGKDINVQKDINIEVENVGINMYNINSFSSIDIETIKKNILQFSENIKKYKNILFICGDYPGYGGAATNCYELQKYFKTIGHNTFGFYFNYETGTNAKHEKYEDHIIDDVCNFKSVEFKPDLIILKSPINIDLKLLFKSPVYYLIGGIYKNDLDIYYYNLNSKEQSDKYINNNVLNHIAKYDKSFVNSQHTMDILKKFYGVSTNIFYSSFVPYVDKKVLIDPDFEKRKYDYGLIVSNFDRKIKNIDKSIKFLKDKENVILIGGGSECYKSYGFTCIDLVDKEEMNKYYKQIKYIVQDSFYESCSNVRIEGLFNGCNIYSNYKNMINYETLISYLKNENKDNTTYDFIIYKNIQYNIDYLSNINIENIEFKILDEENYLNNKINAVPIFLQNKHMKKYSKNILSNYKNLFEYDKNEFNNYINYLINELIEINIKNKKTIEIYSNFLEKFNYLKHCKIKNGIMIISFGDGYNSILEYVVNTYANHTNIPILIYTDCYDSCKYFIDNNNIHVIYISQLFIDPCLFSRIIKTQCYKYSPYERTMYVDIDSICNDRFDYVFDYLDNHDLCMQPSSILNIPFKEIKNKLHPTCIDRYIEYNSKIKMCNENDLVSIYAGGLVFFKKNDVTKRIFDNLSKFWYESGAKFDMPSWMHVLFKEKKNYKMFNLDVKQFNSPHSSIIKSLHYVPKDMINNNINKFIKYKYHEGSGNFELTDINNKFIKKTIIIMYDVDGWVLHDISCKIKQYLSEEYIIIIKNEKQGRMLKNTDADLFFTFNLMNYSIPHIDKNKIICGRTSLMRMPDPIEYKKFKVVHANNYVMLDILKKINSNVFYIPNGVDLFLFYKYKEISTDKTKLRLGICSSTIRKEHKGYNEILLIVNELKKHNIDVEHNSIIANPYDKKTIIENDKLIDYYNNNIDIFFCLSESETAPQPCLEALACGKIVITTHVGLMTDIIINNHNGYLIEDRTNIKNIVNIIIEYNNKSDDEKKNMSRNAIESVQKYSWKNMTMNYKKMFDFYFSLA